MGLNKQNHAKIFVGAGLDEGDGVAPGKYGRHRVVIDPKEIAHDVMEIVKRYFQGLTVYKGRGRWEGKEEPSLVIEIYEPRQVSSNFEERVLQCVGQLTSELDQIAVFYVIDTGLGDNRGGAIFSDGSQKRSRFRDLPVPAGREIPFEKIVDEEPFSKLADEK